MRKIEIKKGDFVIKEKVEITYEKRITPSGNSAEVGPPKKYIEKRTYIIIVKD
jgi:putative transposon-encoded protein